MNLPTAHANDFILAVDREGFSDEPPALLNVADHISGAVSFPAVKNDPIQQKESRSVEIRTENSGHGTRRLVAIADFLSRDLILVPPRSADADDSFSIVERHFICSMRRALYEESPEMTDWMTGTLTARMQRSSGMVRAALENDQFCDVERTIEAVHRPPVMIHTNKDGIVLSGNPVWNACIAGGPISKDLIMSNRDTFEHRRRHVHVRIPYSCRDYHRGDRAIWRHPDFPDLDVMLDDRGRLIGGVPSGYIAVRDSVRVAGK